MLDMEKKASFVVRDAFYFGTKSRGPPRVCNPKIHIRGEK